MRFLNQTEQGVSSDLFDNVHPDILNAYHRVEGEVVLFGSRSGAGHPADEGQPEWPEAGLYHEDTDEEDPEVLFNRMETHVVLESTITPYSMTYSATRLIGQ
jgi:hypothetical protein